MKSFLLSIQLVLGIVPQIIELVKSVELPGKGSDKAATVITIVRHAIDLLPDELKAQIGVDKVESFVGKVIDTVVNFLNKAGVFSKAG